MKHSHDHHSNEEGIGLKQKVILGVGILLYVIGLILGEENNYGIIFFIISYILVGGKVVLTACKNILRGEVFDENFLMSIATIGAFAIGEYPEAVAVMVFYEIGEMFQDYAVDKSRKSISSLMDIRAEYATLLINETEKKVTPEEVNVNDIILIKPGERVPLDGVISILEELL